MSDTYLDNHPRGGAIRTLGRAIAWSALQEDELGLWEDYPEVGENDFGEALHYARNLITWPGNNELQEALRVLEKAVESDA